MSNLQDYLNDQEGTEEETFRIVDDSGANWALRKIKQMNDQIDNNNIFAQKEVDKIERWKRSENDKSQRSIDYFQSLLTDYAMQKKEEDPKFKSIKLPNGSFGFIKSQAMWNYDDEAVIVALEKAELNDFIRVKKEPSKSDIKKAFEVDGGKVINPDTGEILDGITIEEQPDKFNVKVE